MLLRLVFTISRFVVIAVIVVLYIHYFYPQSWGFFTIKPNQPVIDAYVIHDGVADKEKFFSNNMNYGMGICRKGIVLYTALRKLIDKNKKGLEWITLNEDSIAYITQHGIYTSLNSDAGGIYKGRFLFIKTERPFESAIINREKFPAVKKYILADVR